MKTAYVATCGAVRNVVKSLRLRYIEWQHYRSEVEIRRYHEMRHDLAQLEVTERRRQSELSRRHNEIQKG